MSPVQYKDIYEWVFVIFQWCESFLNWVTLPMTQALRFDFNSSSPIWNTIETALNDVVGFISSLWGNPTLIGFFFGVGLTFIIAINVIRIFVDI